MRSLLLAFSAYFLICCSARQRVEVERRLAGALISKAEEQQIGRAMHRQLEQELRFVEDPRVVEYVDGLARGTGTELHVHVVDDASIVNAFATPGGHVYVYTGLLLTAGDAAEVASVVGHEAGHVQARHAARHLLYVYGYQALAGLALGKDPSLLAELGARVAGQGFLAQHRQSEELEADRIALRSLARSGYDARASVRFLERLARDERRTPGFLAFFASHPPTEERIAELRQRIRRRRLEGGRTGEAEHRAALEALRDARQSATTSPSAASSSINTPGSSAPSSAASRSRSARSCTEAAP